ncbi:MAG: hypothetical protein WAL91_13055 [Propionicimonas sp.]
MSTEVAGEQLILAWSSSNLLGASGLGPVAVSPGWTLPPRDNFAGLGEAARYLPDSATIPLGAVPPVCLEYRPGPSGPLLVAKTYSTTSPRAGQYQVHAIRAASGLSPWDLWALATRDVLIQHELGEYPADLPSLSITPARRPRVVREPDDVTELGRLLQCLNEDRPYLIRATDQAHGDSAIRTLLAYLPIGLARDVAVSTFLPSATGWTAGIGLLVSPFSAEAADVDLDLDPAHPRSAPAADAYRSLAEQLLTGGAGQPALRIRSLADLKSLLALERSDLATVALPTLAKALDTPFFDAVLSRLVHHDEPAAVLRRFLSDATVEETFARCLHDDGPQQADLVATLVRVLGASGTPSGRGPLQSWLLQAIGPDQFAGYVLPALVAEARADGVAIHSQDLAALLGRELDADDLRWFTFLALPPTWGPVAEAEFEAFLRGQREPSAVSLDLVRATPARAAGFLDQRLRAKALPATAVAWTLERCPDADLAWLVAVLVRSEAVPRDWVVKTLAARPEAVARAILTTSWPEIADQLGIPGSVAGMLAVQKKSWWAGR